MSDIKEKKGITLLALVITIVIMLLLAGVAIQMTMGENGLIGKSTKAQKAQAKSELYEIAKLSYINLRAKAAEEGQTNPQVELALSTTEFMDKYNVVGDNITDKKGTVIDTKENLVNTLKMLYHDATKNIGGIQIPASDKDKLIIKVNVKNKTTVTFGRLESISNDPNTKPVKIEYESGEEEMTSLYSGNTKEYEPGEYIVKFSGISNYAISGEYNGEYDIEILQWGKIEEINEENEITLFNVSKIYEPEPDKIPIKYMNAKFQQIPEWLFSKKVTSKQISKFWNCDNITSIPENLFKNNVNVINFSRTFYECQGITSIPENLFKYNVNVTDFSQVFYRCEGITNIPEKLFENNINVINFEYAFYRCVGITNIPRNLFKNNTKVTNFRFMFYTSGITEIPEDLFKNNINAEDFSEMFFDCPRITNIPENLFENCINAKNFKSTFGACTGITSIPENLFKNNVNILDFSYTFSGCTGITSIPNNIIECVRKIKEKGGDVYAIFINCTSASNYSSIPSYMK